VKYALHPEAALEHEDQVAYYEARCTGLGRRYHAAFLSTLLRICDAPHRFKMIDANGIRRVSMRGFPFAVFFSRGRWGRAGARDCTASQAAELLDTAVHQTKKVARVTSSAVYSAPR
jgi:hypothetical protein